MCTISDTKVTTHHHHGGQDVDQEADFHLQATNLHPVVNGCVEARAVINHGLEHQCRQDE